MRKTTLKTRTFTLLDLFKFKSLRTNTAYLSALFFFVSMLYIGPSSAIDQFSLDIFILQAILSVSECLAYPIACIFIAKAKRKTIGVKCFLFCALFNLLALLVSTDPSCVYCFGSIAKITLLFFSRFCVAYYYGALFIYVVEIYPEQIRTIGFGTASGVGALGALAMQKVIQIAEENNQDPLVTFTLFACLCMYFTIKLPETLILYTPIIPRIIKNTVVK